MFGIFNHKEGGPVSEGRVKQMSEKFARTPANIAVVPVVLESHAIPYAVEQRVPVIYKDANDAGG